MKTHSLSLRITLIVTSLAVALGASAQEPGVDYERLLLPIVIQGTTAGVFGSLWTTHVAITNHAPRSASIAGYVYAPNGCGIPCGDAPPTPAGITFFPTIYGGTVTQGAILLVERSVAPDVEVHLRAQDITRTAQTWGTQIPVVREKDLYSKAMNLLDVPIGPAFRSTLRVYDVDGTLNGRARIRFYRTNPLLPSPTDPLLSSSSPRPTPDQLVYEMELPLFTERRQGLPTVFDLGYGELWDLARIPEIAAADRVRIEVKPLAPARRIWSFVSTTHNDSQQVTVESPTSP